MLIATLEIQHIVAEHYDLDPAQMRGPSKKRVHSRPRQVAMFLSRRVARRSYSEIGRRFGGRDHSTALHGVGQIDRLCRTDVAIRFEVEAIAEIVSAIIVLRAVWRLKMSMQWGRA